MDLLLDRLLELCLESEAADHHYHSYKIQIGRIIVVKSRILGSFGVCLLIIKMAKEYGLSYKSITTMVRHGC